MLPRRFEFNGLWNLIPHENYFPRNMKRKDLTTNKVGPFPGCLRKDIVPKNMLDSLIFSTEQALGL